MSSTYSSSRRLKPSAGDRHDTNDRTYVDPAVWNGVEITLRMPSDWSRWMPGTPCTIVRSFQLTVRFPRATSARNDESSANRMPGAQIEEPVTAARTSSHTLD